MDIDKVAEAICAAMNPQNTPNEIRERMQHGTYNYRAVAQAAIDALGLKEEHSVGVETSNWPPIKTGSVKPLNHRPISRLVSPWVQVEDTNETALQGLPNP